MESVYIMTLKLTGSRFGRLLVVSRAENKGTHTAWNCVCDCGEELVCIGVNLKSGNTKSCGCFQLETAQKHGHCKEGKTTKIYSVYKSMIQRCENENDKAFSYYGERGVIVCDRWKKSFDCFLEDMGFSYKEGLTLERINVNGNYEPSNCIWVSQQIQMRNTRLSSSNTTGIKGVSITRNGKYHAYIKVDYKKKHLGNFDTLEEASEARRKAEQYYWKSS